VHIVFLFGRGAAMMNRLMHMHTGIWQTITSKPTSWKRPTTLHWSVRNVLRCCSLKYICRSLSLEMQIKPN